MAPSVSSLIENFEIARAESARPELAMIGDFVDWVRGE